VNYALEKTSSEVKKRMKSKTTSDTKSDKKPKDEGQKKVFGD
jgi:hypothetical protein